MNELGLGRTRVDSDSDLDILDTEIFERTEYSHV